MVALVDFGFAQARSQPMTEILNRVKALGPELFDIVLFGYGGLGARSSVGSSECCVVGFARSFSFCVCVVVAVGDRDECITQRPITEWPLCHCLISFFSSGFPLEKAEAYIRLRHPFCINNLSR